jgi:hypothetical protein
VTGSRYARIFWIGAAGTLVLAALIGISSLLRSDFSDTDWQILLTLLTLLVSAGTAVAGLTVVERGQARVGWAAVGLSVGAFVVITASTWDGFDNEDLGKLAGTAAFVLAATLLGTTQLVLHRGRHTWLVAVTWGALALAALTSASAVWSESRDATWKIAASLWIIGVVCWLDLPVLQRFSAAGPPRGSERLVAELDGVEVVATQSSLGVAVDLRPGERLVLRRRG